MDVPRRPLETLSRQEFDRILVGLRGKPVVVNIWASWCAPCRTEMPLLERAARTYEGRVTFLGVASRDDRPAAAAFLDDVGVTYPNVFDVSGDVPSALALRGIPTPPVSDARGTTAHPIV